MANLRSPDKIKGRKISICRNTAGNKVASIIEKEYFLTSSNKIRQISGKNIIP
jgi:hypothetical protein